MRASIRTGGGSFSTLAAFVIGVPLGVGFLWAVLEGPLHTERAERYLHHPVEKVELVMFCCALGALAWKMLGSLREKAALRAEILPTWDGQAIDPTESGKLLVGHETALKRWGSTFLGHRMAAILEFVRDRGSANELDDQLRTLSDAEITKHESSYALVRFITWAIPILGFLGTVLGITDAISNVTPEQLEHNMSSVTGGLSLAFDATALGLGLTMLLMFLTFLVERVEQGILERVDTVVESELGHRFQRTGTEHGPVLEAVHGNTTQMLRAVDGLVEKQIALWARNLESVTRIGKESATQQHGQLTTSLEKAMESTLTRHMQRLTELEAQVLGRQQQMLTAVGQMADALKATAQQHQKGLHEVGERLAQQTQALVRLQEGGAELSRLQEVLARNLSSLAGAGAFEEAVQSLTAAIHLLTTRVSPAAPKKAA
jgi:biopolymer transport protein ExbB/TolQ